MKKQFLILALIVISSQAFSQNAALRTANRYFDQMAYSKAIPEYLRALNKDSTIEEAIYKLADSYRLANNSQQAEKWYGKAVETKGVKPIHRYYYGRMLLANGKVGEAAAFMKSTSITGDEKYIMRSIDNYNSLLSDSGSYTIKACGINSDYADFTAVPYRDGIVFVSSKKKSGPIERTHSWTNQPFLDLYYSRGGAGNFRAPENFSIRLNGKYNDGPACFSADGNTIWFTANNASGQKNSASKNKTFKLKIYSAISDGNNGWTKITPFIYNDNEFNFCHPSLSADGKKLYFSSDMDGSTGGLDIYVCTMSDSGWSKPVNLGPSVNTIGNEVFPCITADNYLYFSSDGWGGLGGLDILISEISAPGKSEPVNAGAPLNTSTDDFSLQYEPKSKGGYISSNRSRGGMDDDIYFFQRTKVTIRGIVVNKETGEPVKSARVVLLTENDSIVVITGENGRFSIPGDFNKEYKIRANAELMGRDEKSFNTNIVHPGLPFIRLELGKERPFQVSILVIDAETKQPLEGASIKDNEKGMVLGKSDMGGLYIQPIIAEKDETFEITLDGYRPKLILMKGQEGEKPRDMHFVAEMIKAPGPFSDWYKIIYYDFDKFNIRNDAVPVLDEVAEFLKKNNNVRISISSSTDSRASKEYNDRLSKNRSLSVKTYLTNKGVSPSQLARIQWTGESILVNQCNDFAPCTEEMHQLNRRSEMLVIEVK